MMSEEILLLKKHNEDLQCQYDLLVDVWNDIGLSLEGCITEKALQRSKKAMVQKWADDVRVQLDSL